jgi:hypothetical protein
MRSRPPGRGPGLRDSLESSDADLIELIWKFVESVRGKPAKSSRVAVRAASCPLAPVFRGEG